MGSWSPPPPIKLSSFMASFSIATVSSPASRELSSGPATPSSFMAQHSENTSSRILSNSLLRIRSIHACFCSLTFFTLPTAPSFSCALILPSGALFAFFPVILATILPGRALTLPTRPPIFARRDIACARRVWERERGKRASRVWAARELG